MNLGIPAARGSVMSCQSLSMTAADADPLPSYHRSVHFSGESDRKSLECSLEYHGENDSDTSGGSWSGYPRAAMSRSAPAACPSPLPPQACPSSSQQGAESPAARFPRLEECAHFHYGRVALGGLRAKLVTSTPQAHDNAQDDVGWVTVSVRPHCMDGSVSSEQWSAGEGSGEEEWRVTRSSDNFKMLDTMLHRCIYDRKVSGLPELETGVDEALARGLEAYASLIADYLHHFSIIADDSINCGPILNWFQMDNKGHRLLVASEDSNSINTPAVAAAYSVRRYVSQARDEISFEVGDMISVIDMPGPSESTWWRGKRGFSVGFFPQQCVAVIGDKVPRNMKQPPPIVGSVAVAPIKPVLRKHGKLISLFRSFILSRPSRRSLRQQGILKERVFGCDLGEHLLNKGHQVPLVLSSCAAIIEQYGCVDGIYRLSGASSTTQRLRLAFDEERPPAPGPPQDIHAIASLLKMYFRELPNPLCTYQLYTCFVSAVQGSPDPAGTEASCSRRLDDAEKLLRMREAVGKLPPPHYRTLAFLMQHLHKMSLLGSSTGMTARNMAIVWAPNLLRSPLQQHALQGVAVQAVVTEFLICYAELIFSEEQAGQEGCELTDYVGDLLMEEGPAGMARRPKSLPLATPTKLLSLEEARSKQQLRPSGAKEPHYIEVGGGPNSLPRYHTVIQLPAGGGKRGLKRSPSGWRGLFFRASKHRPPPSPCTEAARPAPSVLAQEQQGPSSTQQQLPAITHTAPNMLVDVEEGRAARSCESLTSEGDCLPPLATQPQPQPVNQHNRSVSCDSYFEASLAELAGMRLRLTSQEREMDIFSEDDNTARQTWNKEASSGDTSAEPSPTKLPRSTNTDSHSPQDTRKRTKLEEQLSDLLFIDCSTPEHSGGRGKVAALTPTTPTNLGTASPQPETENKRVCKETPESQNNSTVTTPQGQGSFKVKMRERGSPRKAGKAANIRHSHGMATLTPHQPSVNPHRHSTLIRVDWPTQDQSYQLPLPLDGYSRLQSDSEASILTSKTHSQDSLAKRFLIGSNDTLNNDLETSGFGAELIEKFKSKDLSSFVTKDTKNLNSTKTDDFPGFGSAMEVDLSKFKSGDKNVGLVTFGAEKNAKKSENSLSSDVKNDEQKDSNGFHETSDMNNDLKCFGTGGIIQNFNFQHGGLVSVGHTVEVQQNPSERRFLSLISIASKSIENTSQSDESSEILTGVVTKGDSAENLDGRIFSLQNSPSAKSDFKRYANVDVQTQDKPYENIAMERSTAMVGSSESEQLYDDVESGNRNSDALKTSVNSSKTDEVEVLVTPSDENFSSNNMADSLEDSASPMNISYQNLNRLSMLSGDSCKGPSKESTPTFSPTEKERTEEIYECFSFARPSYIHLASSSGSSTQLSPQQPTKSPIKSTISIIYKSPTKEYPNTKEKNDDVGVYEDVLGDNVAVPKICDASLPLQQACQPENLISLDSPVKEKIVNVKTGDTEDVDIYNKVKFFRKSVSEVNTLILDSENGDSSVFEDSLEIEPSGECQVMKSAPGFYENVHFEGTPVKSNAYENVMMPKNEQKACNAKKSETNLNNGIKTDKSAVELCEEQSKIFPKLNLSDFDKENTAHNGNCDKSLDEKVKVRRSSTNVRQLAYKFESPTENKPAFSFDRSSRSSLTHGDGILNSLERLREVDSVFDRTKAVSLCENRGSKLKDNRKVPCLRAKNNRLTKYSVNTRSLDENAFVKEFGNRQGLHKNHTSEKEMEVFIEDTVNKSSQQENSDLNLNLESIERPSNLSLNFPGRTEKADHFANRYTSITPTTENKISLVQARLSPKKNYRQRLPDLESPDSPQGNSSGDDSMKKEKNDKLSRERIEKYKEERRLFLREKYNQSSFRGVSDLPKTDDNSDEVQLRNPHKLERRNTTDAAQRNKFTNAKNITAKCSAEPVLDDTPKITMMQRKLSLDPGKISQKGKNLESQDCRAAGTALISQRPKTLGASFGIATSAVSNEEKFDLSTGKAEIVTPNSARKEKRSPSFNIRDMAAKFEQKSSAPN